MPIIAILGAGRKARRYVTKIAPNGKKAETSEDQTKAHNFYNNTIDGAMENAKAIFVGEKLESMIVPFKPRGRAVAAQRILAKAQAKLAKDAPGVKAAKKSKEAAATAAIATAAV